MTSLFCLFPTGSNVVFLMRLSAFRVFVWLCVAVLCCDLLCVAVCGCGLLCVAVRTLWERCANLIPLRLNLIRANGVGFKLDSNSKTNLVKRCLRKRLFFKFILFCLHSLNCVIWNVCANAMTQTQWRKRNDANNHLTQFRETQC